MANFVKDWLPLAVHIAWKTRRLIPRSANRVGKTNYDYTDPLHPFVRGTMGSSWVKKAQPYHLILPLLASRSPRDVDPKLMSVINRAGKDLSIDVTSVQAEKTEAAFLRYIQVRSPTDYKRQDGQKTCECIADYLEREIEFARSASRTKLRCTPPTPLEEIERSIKFRIGNCGECAALAYRMFLEFRGRDKVSKDFGYGPRYLAYPKDRPQVQHVVWYGDHHFDIGS